MANTAINRQKIREFIQNISYSDLKHCCSEIAENDDFFTHPASTGIHHGYVGGLWTHTKEVIDYALDFSRSFEGVDTDILIAAGLWHDFCKIWDYNLTTFFKDEYKNLPRHYVTVEDCGNYKKVYIADTDYKGKIHHVTGSTAEFTHYALKNNVDRKTIQQIQHCIIAHHGHKQEWGSIKQPQTLEAVILHHADYLSAAFGKTKEKPI